MSTASQTSQTQNVRFLTLASHSPSVASLATNSWKLSKGHMKCHQQKCDKTSNQQFHLLITSVVNWCITRMRQRDLLPIVTSGLDIKKLFGLQWCQLELEPSLVRLRSSLCVCWQVERRSCGVVL